MSHKEGLVYRLAHGLASSVFQHPPPHVFIYEAYFLIHITRRAGDPMMIRLAFGYALSVGR